MCRVGTKKRFSFQSAHTKIGSRGDNSARLLGGKWTLQFSYQKFVLNRITAYRNSFPTAWTSLITDTDQKFSDFIWYPSNIYSLSTVLASWVVLSTKWPVTCQKWSSKFYLVAPAATPKQTATSSKRALPIFFIVWRGWQIWGGKATTKRIVERFFSYWGVISHSSSMAAQ